MPFANICYWEERLLRLALAFGFFFSASGSLTFGCFLSASSSSTPLLRFAAFFGFVLGATPDDVEGVGLHALEWKLRKERSTVI